jgi:cobalt-zinc-cadmium efflux system membrane fusion protein
MTFERSLLHAGLWPVLIALALASGCSDRPPDEEVPAETEAPPSVQEAPAAAQVVRLDTRQAAELDVQTVAVQSGSFRYAVTLPGTVYPAPENFSIVSAPISGRVANIYAHEGEAVRKGQVLLELESLEFANLAAEYLQARAEEAYQESQVERLQLLVEKKISPQSALDKAQADLLRASAAVSGTYARLKAIGIRDEQIAAWSAAQPERPLLQIYAPISGVIDRHDVDLGQSVTSYEQMMSLIDPSRVLVRGYVSPEEAPALTPGDPVTIAQKDFPDLQLAAKVATLNPALDEQNKCSCRSPSARRSRCSPCRSRPSSTKASRPPSSSAPTRTRSRSATSRWAA